MELTELKNNRNTTTNWMNSVMESSFHYYPSIHSIPFYPSTEDRNSKGEDRSVEVT